MARIFDVFRADRQNNFGRVGLRVMLVGVLAMGMAGCAEYDTDSMSGAAVDIPDQTPLSQETPMITAPTPSPTPGAVGGGR